MTPDLQALVARLTAALAPSTTDHMNYGFPIQLTQAEARVLVDSLAKAERERDRALEFEGRAMRMLKENTQVLEAVAAERDAILSTLRDAESPAPTEATAQKESFVRGEMGMAAADRAQTTLKRPPDTRDGEIAELRARLDTAWEAVRIRDETINATVKTRDATIFTLRAAVATARAALAPLLNSDNYDAGGDWRADSNPFEIAAKALATINAVTPSKGE